MNNPLIKQLSHKTDRRIRMRLRFIATQRWIEDQKRLLVLGVGAPVIAVAVLVLVFFAPSFSGVLEGPDAERIALNVQAAQALELQKTETGIYHLTRVIKEGYDKPAYVALTEGAVLAAPQRIDVVESWQHNDISLALIESTAHDYAFQAYLAVPHEGEIGVHFYGDPRDEALPNTRVVFDQAHDLATLYSGYQTDERPSIPLIPENAELISASPIIYAYAPAESLVIHAEIDPDTFLIIRETIFVTADNGQFEMSVIEYHDRELLPASAFDEVFSPERYPFTRISLAQ